MDEKENLSVLRENRLYQPIFCLPVRLGGFWDRETGSTIQGIRHFWRVGILGNGIPLLWESEAKAHGITLDGQSRLISQ